MDSETLRSDKPFGRRQGSCFLRVSAGALSGADVREGKEISVEQPKGNLVLCSRAFALKVHPPARGRSRSLLSPCISELECFFLHQAEDFLSHSAAVGGVPSLIFRSGKDKSLFAKFRAEFFAFRR